MIKNKNERFVKPFVKQVRAAGRTNIHGKTSTESERVPGRNSGHEWGNRARQEKWTFYFKPIQLICKLTR